MAKLGEKSGEIVQCRICGKEIYKTKTRLKRSKGKHYCSHECQDIGRHIDAHEMRHCEVCGKPFEVAKRLSQRFCSQKCQNEWQKTQVGPLNTRYHRIDRECSWCGAVVHVPPYRINSQEHFFCNITCRQEWFSNVYSQTEEWKEESRRRAVEILESGVISYTNSTPQNIVDDILDELNIRYIREYNLLYYAADNYLEDSNLIIEVMGDYWHANPMKYKNIKYDKQKKAVGRDKAKHTFVKNQYGIEILYLWEDDIIHSRDKCKALIELYIETNGLLPNYHSFNYSMVDGDIKLNEDIIIPHQDYDAEQIA